MIINRSATPGVKMKCFAWVPIKLGDEMHFMNRFATREPLSSELSEDDVAFLNKHKAKGDYIAPLDIYTKSGRVYRYAEKVMKESGVNAFKLMREIHRNGEPGI